MIEQVVVFDLDDTLYKEIDFVRSAFAEIAAMTGDVGALDYMWQCREHGENVFGCIIEHYKLDTTIHDLVNIYRNHAPNIVLDKDVKINLDTLCEKGYTLGLMTDGRSVTQRNKISALNLQRWISDENILISEELGFGKPDERCYYYFMNRYMGASFAYVGDNLDKDFVTANKLGWQTICLLDDGRNIHKQDFSISEEYLPKLKINQLSDILL